MREIEINKKSFNVRGLTRGQIKKLRKDGINLVTLTRENADEVVDKVFGLVFDAETVDVIDDMPNSAAMELWQAVLKETYGAWDEEKN